MAETEPPAAADHGRSRIGRVALLITLGGLGSRLLGLVREQLAAGYFGAGDDIAAFQIADNVSTLLFDLVISGMLQAALIPVLVEFAGDHAREELRRIAGTITTVALVSVGVAVILGEIFTGTVVRLMTAIGSGDAARDPATTALTVDLVRIVLPGVLLLALGTIFSAVLYALDRPGGPALALVVRNLVVVVAILTLSRWMGVKSMAVGVLVGGMSVAAIHLPALAQAGALPTLRLELRHPAVRRIGLLYLPVFLGLLVSTVQVVVDRNLAWRAEADALGAMRYATTLVQSVLGLIAAAISLAALPALAGHFTGRDERAFSATLESALRYVTILIVPAVFGMAVLARPLVGVIFQHGETGPAEASSIALVLLGYLPGTLFAAFDQVLIYAFYAQQSTWTPVLVGVVASGGYFVVAAVVADRYGALGLAIANSVQFVVHTLVLGWLGRSLLAGLRRRFAGLLALCGGGAGLCAAAALAGLGLTRLVLPSGAIRDVVELVVAASAGAAAYAGVLWTARVPEIAALVARLPIRLRNR